MLQLKKLAADADRNLILTIEGPGDQLPEGDAFRYDVGIDGGNQIVCTVHTDNHPALILLGEKIIYGDDVEVPAEDAPFDEWFRKNFVPKDQGGLPEEEEVEQIDLLDPGKDEVPEQIAVQEDQGDDDADLLAGLKALKRKELQNVAKIVRVRAVGKNTEIIDRLMKEAPREALIKMVLGEEAPADPEVTEKPEPDPEPPQEISEEDKEKLKAVPEEITDAVEEAVTKSPKRRRRKKADPKPKGPSLIEQARTRFLADSGLTSALQALASEFGARRVSLVVSELIKGGGSGLPMGHVPGLVVSVTRNHPARDGRKWGRCEYVVECLDAGRLKLVGFTGNRPEIGKLVSSEFDSMNDLMQVISGRSYARVTLWTFFRLGEAKAEGRISHDPREV